MSKDQNATPKASRTFIGIKSTTTRGAMFRAVLEGLAFEARAIADAMVSQTTKTWRNGGHSVVRDFSLHRLFLSDILIRLCERIPYA